MPVITAPLMKGRGIAGTTDYTDKMPENYTVVAEEIRGAPGYLLAHSGLTLFADGVGADRGGHWNERQNKHFRVSGGQLVTVSDSGAVAQIGPVTGNGQASMSHSFNNQSIVADGKWWLYNQTDGLRRINDLDLGVPIHHCWLAQRFFLTDGEYIFHTKALNETAIDSLAYATAELSPDPTLAVAATADNELLVMDRYTCQYFIDRATDNFAYQWIQSKAVWCGVVGSHAWTEIAGQFILLGSGRGESITVNAVSVGRYDSLASRAVDQIIGEYTEAELQTAVLESRVVDRNVFVIVRLPEHTLMLNVTVADKFGVENAWTIVKSQIGEVGPWCGANGVFHPNVGWVYGDCMSGNIGILDPASATQYGEQQEFIAYTPLFDAEAASIDELEIDTIPGHQVNQDNVTCFLSSTTDGVTWGKEVIFRYGSKQDYDSRFIARGPGGLLYVRKFAGFKLRLVTPERTAMSKATITYG